MQLVRDKRYQEAFASPESVEKVEVRGTQHTAMTVEDGVLDCGA